MAQEEERSYYRAMTAEEINDENEKFQRKLTEKLHKELPAKMNALWDLQEESFEGDEDSVNGVRHPIPVNQTNGHGREVNGYHNGVVVHNDEREMLLKVRERENQELTKNLDEARRRYQRDANEWKGEVSKLSMEKERVTQSLNDCQEVLKTYKERFHSLQETYDKVVESEKRLRNELEISKLTLADKDKMLKIMENGTEDNRIASQLEKQMQMKEEQHKVEIKNLNDQLELSFKKCKNYEREIYELEKKVKSLQKKNDETLVEKTETITRLMTQINELQHSFEKSVYAPSDIQERLLAENEATMRNLRTQLAEKDSNIQLLQNELTILRKSLEERHGDPERRRESSSLRERVLDLELKLTEKEMQLANLCVKNSVRSARSTVASVQTDPWSVDDNNIQYLRFHEERMTNLREELEERFQNELAEKETQIERLQAENQQIKQIYLDLEEERNSIDVRKLQEELSTAKDRLLELKKNHSEFCQPNLEKRERETCLLKERVQELEGELSDREQQQKVYEMAKETNDRIFNELKKLLSAEKDEKKKLEEDIAKFERQILNLTDDVHNLEEQISRMESAHKEELESLKSSQTSRTSVGTSPLRGSAALSPKAKENQSVCTSPMGKVLTETEIMRLLHNLALKHEEERAHYVARIEELQDVLMRAKRHLSENGEKDCTDASTMTDDKSISSEPSNELILELWRKLEDLRKENEKLTVRSRQIDEVEMELSRANEQCSKMQDKVSRLKGDLSSASEKYAKLKEHSKSYKEYFRKVILEINEDRQKEVRKWKEEREAWEKTKLLWEKERVKREQALLDLRAQVQNLHNPSHVDGVVNVARLYDELIASLRSDRASV